MQMCFLHLFKMNQLVQGLPTFFLKGQIGKILGFAGHTDCCSYLPLPLGWKSSHRLQVKEWAWLRYKKSLFTETGGGGRWDCSPLNYQSKVCLKYNMYTYAEKYICFSLTWDRVSLSAN